MEIYVYISIAAIGLIIAGYGIYMHEKGKKADEETKIDERYERYMKSAVFKRNFGILLALTILSIAVLPIYVGYIGFAALGLYILAYSMHISTGKPYKTICTVLGIVVVIAAVSIYLMVTSR